MQFGIFYEHQLPRPWTDGTEQQLFQEALEQVELADRLGIDYAWEVEHHFLEEYSHSSAPEVFLAAASQRTQRIRLGHGIVLAPPPYNHPARVAERIATLDLVSNGRVDFGTGESASRQSWKVLILRQRSVERCGVRQSNRLPICSSWSRTLATRAPTFRCHVGTLCPSQSRSRIHRCGWHARIAIRFALPPG